jgi:hypothetical protein
LFWPAASAGVGQRGKDEASRGGFGLPNHQCAP